jgi:hypothetical protein
VEESPGCRVHGSSACFLDLLLDGLAWLFVQLIDAALQFQKEGFASVLHFMDIATNFFFVGLLGNPHPVP